MYKGIFASKRIIDMKVFNLIETDSDITIEVRGEIGGSWWNEGVTYAKVAAQLKGAVNSKKKVTVKINSLGGDVDEALAIYELLLSMGDRVTTECYGRCASAATIIAMAGHQRLMSRYALFLVHKCWSGVIGNENVLEEELAAQRAINDRLAQIYIDRTGSTRETIEELMNRFNGDGEFLNVEQAMEYGFITGQLPDEVKPADSDYLKEKIKDMFKIKNNKDMKKSITTLALLCAVLACQDLEAKDNKALLDDEQLGKINDRLKELEDKVTAAESKATEAENKLTQALKDKKDAEDKANDLQKKVDEKQAIIDKTPSGATHTPGSETKTEKSFEDSWKDSDTYKEACAELGVEP